MNLIGLSFCEPTRCMEVVVKRSDPQMKIRLPKPLKDWIEEKAAENVRSQNAEIVYRLEQAKKLQEAA